MISNETLDFELFQALLQYSTDLVCIIDAKGIVRYASPSYAHTLGYSPTDLIGTHSSSRIHPEDKDRVMATLRDAIQSTSGPIRDQFRYLHANGSWRLLQTAGTNHLEHPVIRGMVINVTDITDRVQAEERLRQTEAQYRGVFEATSDGLIILDFDGVMADVNLAVCAMHGYRREELVGQPAKILIHPEHHASFAENLATVERGQTYRAQGIDRRRDGTEIHVEVHSSPATFGGRPHMLSVLRDVTERVRAYDLLEQRVEERTRELSTLLNVSRNVASTLQLEPVLNLILDEIKMVMDYSGAGIGLIQHDQLSIIGYRGPSASQDLSHSYGPGQWPAWESLRQGEAVLIDDIRGDELQAVAYRRAVGENLHTAHAHVSSFLAVPMVLRDEVIGALSVVHCQPGYYTDHHANLARAVADHAAVAIENAGLYERAQEVAVLEERQRLARELHDSVSQALYGIALGTQTARRLLSHDPQGVDDALQYVLTQAEAGLAEMRALIFDLRPDALERDGLVLALSRQAAAIGARQAIAVSTRLGAEPDAPFAVKEAIYRIAQEALHNIIKHAQAQNVVIDLAYADDIITLEVCDDGKGFDTGGTFPSHLGLKTMRERATRAGGTVQLTSTPGRGARVRAAIPCPMPT